MNAEMGTVRAIIGVLAFSKIRLNVYLQKIQFKPYTRDQQNITFLGSTLIWPVHFQANTFGKGMNPLILPAMG